MCKKLTILYVFGMLNLLFPRQVVSQEAINHRDKMKSIVSNWRVKNKLANTSLFLIYKQGRKSKSTEIEILSSASGYKEYILPLSPINFPECSGDTDFLLEDYNLDKYPDLWAIKSKGTKSYKVELTILDGSTNFQQVLNKRQLPLEADGSFLFEPRTNSKIVRSPGIEITLEKRQPDLVAVKKQNLKTGFMEIHILNGATNFDRFKIQQSLNVRGPEIDFFKFFDTNKDGIDDVFLGKTQPDMSMKVTVVKGPEYNVILGEKISTLESQLNENKPVAINECIKAVLFATGTFIGVSEIVAGAATVGTMISALQAAGASAKMAMVMGTWESTLSGKACYMGLTKVFNLNNEIETLKREIERQRSGEGSRPGNPVGNNRIEGHERDRPNPREGIVIITEFD